MRRSVFSLVISVVLIAGITIGQGLAQEAPDLGVGLTLLDSDGKHKVSFAPDEVIMVVISLDNVKEEEDAAGNVSILDAEDIITSAGFSDKDFHRFLQFTAPGGAIITAVDLIGTDDPPPPQVRLVAGKLFQVETVEVLEGSRAGDAASGFKLKVGPFKVRDFYPLTKPGPYLARVIISMRTYPETAVQLLSGSPYVPLGAADWFGTVVSNTVNFSIQAHPGDFNGDGCVDQADLEIIMAAIRGAEPRDLSMDLNGDGALNIADGRFLVTRFTNPRGAPCP